MSDHINLKRSETSNKDKNSKENDFKLAVKTGVSSWLRSSNKNFNEFTDLRFKYAPGAEKSANNDNNGPFGFGVIKLIEGDDFCPVKALDTVNDILSVDAFTSNADKVQPLISMLLYGITPLLAPDYRKSIKSLSSMYIDNIINDDEIKLITKSMIFTKIAEIMYLKSCHHKNASKVKTTEVWAEMNYNQLNNIEDDNYSSIQNIKNTFSKYVTIKNKQHTPINRIAEKIAGILIDLKNNSKSIDFTDAAIKAKEISELMSVLDRKILAILPMNISFENFGYLNKAGNLKFNEDFFRYFNNADVFDSDVYMLGITMDDNFSGELVTKAGGKVSKIERLTGVISRLKEGYEYKQPEEIEKLNLLLKKNNNYNVDDADVSDKTKKYTGSTMSGGKKYTYKNTKF